MCLLFRTGHKVCGYPGCSKQCYVEPSGRVHDYCSRTHASEHKVLQDRARRHHWQQQQPGSSHPPRTQSGIVSWRTGADLILAPCNPALTKKHSHCCFNIEWCWMPTQEDCVGVLTGDNCSPIDVACEWCTSTLDFFFCFVVYNNFA